MEFTGVHSSNYVRACYYLAASFNTTQRPSSLCSRHLVEAELRMCGASICILRIRTFALFLLPFPLRVTQASAKCLLAALVTLCERLTPADEKRRTSPSIQPTRQPSLAIRAARRAPRMCSAVAIRELGLTPRLAQTRNVVLMKPLALRLGASSRLSPAFH